MHFSKMRKRELDATMMMANLVNVDCKHSAGYPMCIFCAIIVMHSRRNEERFIFHYLSLSLSVSFERETVSIDQRLWIMVYI